MSLKNRLVLRLNPTRSSLLFTTVFTAVLGFSGCADATLELAAEPLEDAPTTADADPTSEVVPTAEDAAILHFLNSPDTTFAVLDDDVGLDRRGAERLVRHRDGADRTFGTADDAPFVSVADVVATPWVGVGSLDAIDAWLYALALDGEHIEGVAFTEDEARTALSLANTATVSELDVDMDLDVRAAEGIVEGRPFASLTEVGQVEWVGPASLERLRAACAKVQGAED